MQGQSGHGDKGVTRWPRSPTPSQALQPRRADSSTDRKADVLSQAVPACVPAGAGTVSAHRSRASAAWAQRTGPVSPPARRRGAGRLLPHAGPREIRTHTWKQLAGVRRLPPPRRLSGRPSISRTAGIGRKAAGEVSYLSPPQLTVAQLSWARAKGGKRYGTATSNLTRRRAIRFILSDHSDPASLALQQVALVAVLKPPQG